MACRVSPRVASAFCCTNEFSYGEPTSWHGVQANIHFFSPHADKWISKSINNVFVRMNVWNVSGCNPLKALLECAIDRKMTQPRIMVAGTTMDTCIQNVLDDPIRLPVVLPPSDPSEQNRWIPIRTGELGRESTVSLEDRIKDNLTSTILSFAVVVFGTGWSAGQAVDSKWSIKRG